MRRHRRVKILATLGPASSNPEMAGKLFEAGADVFRLNMSHLPREQLADKVAMLRALESVYRRPVGILVDLQGPKLRVGAFADEAGVMLDVGATFTLDSDKKPGDATRVHLPHPEILQALEKGHALILDDASRSDTYPYIEIDEDDVTVEHEASVSKIGEEQLFYLMSRGLTEAEASAMIVTGFIEPLVKELPMEYAVEMNRLIELQMEGSVG